MKEYKKVSTWGNGVDEELLERSRFLVQELETKTQSKNFRELLLKFYPKLNKKSYITLLTYYLRGTMRDDSDKIMIPQPLLALIEDKEEELLTSNYSAREFLEAFSRDVAQIEIIEWSKPDKRVRVIENIRLEPEIILAFKHEQENRDAKKDRVYLISGKSFTTKKRDSIIKKLRNHEQQVTHSKNIDLFEQLHSIPQRIFTQALEKNGKKALQLALDMDNQQQIRILNNIYDQPYQFYKEVEKSDRAFSIGEHIATLKSKIRKTLTSHWVECDIKSAQLAIVARLWNIPYIEQFLKQGGSVWEYLIESFNLTKETKPILKTALYTTCFGGGTETISEILSPLGIGKLWRKNPFIKELLAGRTRQLNKITIEGGLYDVKGKFLPLGVFDEKSILAQQAQSVETELLRPIFNLAGRNKGKNGFTICLYQFDGLSFIPNRHVNKDKWVKKLKEVLKEQAKYLGVYTELEVCK